MVSDRPGREIPKEYREIVNHQIDQHGWRYDATRKGHPQLIPAATAPSARSRPRPATSAASATSYPRSATRAASGHQE